EMYYPGRVGENFLFLRTDISAYAPQWMLVPLLFVAACTAIALLYVVNYLIIKLAHSKLFKRKTQQNNK
ncbi:MAG: hypothetical protein K2K31_01320, partial [Clostridia bacterium]|nr:hypothetical protein [Clostridia bacterium]